MPKSLNQPRPELNSTEKLEALLEFLNKHPFRYVTHDELVNGLGDNFDAVTLNYAQGLKYPPATGSTKSSTVYRLQANWSQIMQTKLVEEWVSGRDGVMRYILTLRGIEFLNQLKLSRSSRRLEILTFSLIALTVVLTVVSIPIATDALYNLQVQGGVYQNVTPTILASTYYVGSLIVMLVLLLSIIIVLLEYHSGFITKLWRRRR